MREWLVAIPDSDIAIAVGADLRCGDRLRGLNPRDARHMIVAAAAFKA